MAVVVAAAIVVVFVMCTLNMLFTFGVVRRLRQHTELLSGMLPEPDEVFPAQDPTVSVGSSPGDFTGTTVDGKPVSFDLLRARHSRSIAVFLSPDCPSCVRQASDVVLDLQDLAVGKESVLAVVLDGDGADILADKLSRVAHVVVEPTEGGSITEAFELLGVPAMCMLDEAGVVLATGRSLDQLTAPANA